MILYFILIQPNQNLVQYLELSIGICTCYTFKSKWTIGVWPIKTIVVLYSIMFENCMTIVSILLQYGYLNYSFLLILKNYNVL
jgi:hypothetical protein